MLQKGTSLQMKTKDVNRKIDTLTILCKLSGADQSGDLKGVLADGAVAQVLSAFSSVRISLLFQL